VYTAQTLSGSYAEFCVAKEGHTFKLPEGLTFAEGAALGIPYFTAYRALFLESVSSIRRATFTLLGTCPLVHPNCFSLRVRVMLL